MFTNGTSKDGTRYSTSSFRPDNLEVKFINDFNNTLFIYESNFIRYLETPATQDSNPLYFNAALKTNFLLNTKRLDAVEDLSTLEAL